MENIFFDRKRQLTECRQCKSSKKKHFQKGLCSPCFYMIRNKNPRYKIKHKKAVLKWHKANPDAVRKIRRRANIKYQLTKAGRRKHVAAQQAYLKRKIKIAGTK